MRNHINPPINNINNFNSTNSSSHHLSNRSRGENRIKTDRHREKRITVGFTTDEYKVIKKLQSSFGIESASKLIRHLILFPKRRFYSKQFNLEMQILSNLDNHFHDIDMILSTDYFNNYNLLSTLTSNSNNFNFSNTSTTENSKSDDKLLNGKDENGNEENGDENNSDSTPLNFISGLNLSNHSTAINSNVNTKHRIRKDKYKTINKKHIIIILKQMNNHIRKVSNRIEKIEDKLNQMKIEKKHQLESKRG